MDGFVWITSILAEILMGRGVGLLVLGRRFRRILRLIVRWMRRLRLRSKV